MTLEKISVVWGEASVPTPVVNTNLRWCPAIVFHLGIVEIEDLSSCRERKSALRFGNGFTPQIFNMVYSAGV
jgi:hypothetical protein